MQRSMATPTEEDTRLLVLICGEWGKVPDGYPNDASSQLERDERFINELAYNGGTNVGHGPITTLFLSLVLFLVPAH